MIEMYMTTGYITAVYMTAAYMTALYMNALFVVEVPTLLYTEWTWLEFSRLRNVVFVTAVYLTAV